MQLNVDRAKLALQLSAKIAEIEAAAEAELEHLRAGRVELAAADQELARHFELLAQGLRQGTIEQDNSGGLRGSLITPGGGARHELPERPARESGHSDKKYTIDHAMRSVREICTSTLGSLQAALTVLEMSPDETIGIDSEHYENLIRVQPDFRAISTKVGVYWL